MLIDRKAKPWIVVCAGIFVAATAYYIPYQRQSMGHPSGGSWPGLIYGIAGSTAMLIAMLLAARKKTRYPRLGRVYYWMQAHVWIGFLSYPLIIYHAGGFSWGGPLTQIVMWLFTFVILSGIVGLALQQIIPGRLMREVPAETIYVQIDHVLEKIREEADAIVRPIRAQRESAIAEADEGGTAVAVVATSSAVGAFTAFYTDQIKPFLADKFLASATLANDSSARAAFEEWRTRLPETFNADVDRLQGLVDERRQLDHQRRLHRYLHAWLIVHVPISYLLVVLAAIHGFMAFKYMSRTP